MTHLLTHSRKAGLTLPYAAAFLRFTHATAEQL